MGGGSPGCHRGSLWQGGAADRSVPEGDGGAGGQRQGAAAALHRGAAGPRRPRREAAPDHQQQLRHHPQREPGPLRHPGHQGHRQSGTSAGTGTATASGMRPGLRERDQGLREFTLCFGNLPGTSGTRPGLRERARGFPNGSLASGMRPWLSLGPRRVVQGPRLLPTGSGQSWVGDPPEQSFPRGSVVPWRCWRCCSASRWGRVSPPNAAGTGGLAGSPPWAAACTRWAVPPWLLLSPVPAERAAPGPGGGRARSLRRVQPALLLQHRVSARPCPCPGF